MDQLHTCQLVIWHSKVKTHNIYFGILNSKCWIYNCERKNWIKISKFKKPKEEEFEFRILNSKFQMGNLNSEFWVENSKRDVWIFWIQNSTWDIWIQNSEFKIPNGSFEFRILSSKFQFVFWNSEIWIQNLNFCFEIQDADLLLSLYWLYSI